jgi:hypothetical protein
LFLILYEHIGYNKNITYISVIITVTYFFLPINGSHAKRTLAFFLPINGSHAKRTLAFQNDREEIEEDSTMPFIGNEKCKKQGTMNN